MTPHHDPRPATKGDLNQLREELRDELLAKMREMQNELRDELIEKMRDMQTEVIRAFQNWAGPVAIQLRSIPQIEARLGLLEERVAAIESGQGPKPGASM